MSLHISFQYMLDNKAELESHTPLFAFVFEWQNYLAMFVSWFPTELFGVVVLFPKQTLSISSLSSSLCYYLQMSVLLNFPSLWVFLHIFTILLVWMSHSSHHWPQIYSIFIFYLERPYLYSILGFPRSQGCLNIKYDTGNSIIFKNLVLYFTTLKKGHFHSEGYLFSSCDLGKSLCASFISTVWHKCRTLWHYFILSYCLSNQCHMKKGINPHKEPPRYAFWNF